MPLHQNGLQSVPLAQVRSAGGPQDPPRQPLELWVAPVAGSDAGKASMRLWLTHCRNQVQPKAA